MTVFKTTVICANCRKVGECKDTSGAMPDVGIDSAKGGWVVVIRYSLLGQEMFRTAFCSLDCARTRLGALMEGEAL